MQADKFTVTIEVEVLSLNTVPGLVQEAAEIKQTGNMNVKLNLYYPTEKKEK